MILPSTAAKSSSSCFAHPSASLRRTICTAAFSNAHRRPISRPSFGKPQFPALSANASRPVTASLRCFVDTKAKPPFDKINQKAEEKVAKKPLESHPELVSIESTVRPMVGREIAEPEKEKPADMMGGLKSDFNTITNTFALKDVPRDVLYLGLAGTLPYLATSLSTVFLAWDMQQAAHAGSGYLLSADTASWALDYLEPLQIGYGAVIISFLGAIHWGLEYAGYGGQHDHRRYAIGVIAPAIAWPSILLPVEYALISQFLAFNWLYFVDTRATRQGLTPQWYGTYRFVLTFIVGASIVISLIGRGQIANHVAPLPNPAKGMQELRDSQWENLEKEEEERKHSQSGQEINSANS